MMPGIGGLGREPAPPALPCLGGPLHGARIDGTEHEQSPPTLAVRCATTAVAALREVPLRNFDPWRFQRRASKVFLKLSAAHSGGQVDNCPSATVPCGAHRCMGNMKQQAVLLRNICWSLVSKVAMLQSSLSRAQYAFALRRWSQCSWSFAVVGWAPLAKASGSVVYGGQSSRTPLTRPHETGREASKHADPPAHVEVGTRTLCS